mgnify:CR=1 FL=1
MARDEADDGAQGIIDILTPYTFVKKVEHFFRGLKYDKVRFVVPRLALFR